MPATPKQQISADQFARLKSLTQGESTVMAVAIRQNNLSLPWIEREVTVTRDSGLLRVEAAVEFGGQTAGVTWFEPTREVVGRPVLIVGMYCGEPACYLSPPPRNRNLEIGDVTACEAKAWADAPAAI